MVSVELFKKYLIESEADFQSYNDLELEETIVLFIQSDISQTGNIIFEKFKINQSDFLEEFLLELAEFCAENSLSNDPIVQALKSTNYSSFNDKIEFIENLKIAMKRSQRAEMRKIMSKLEYEIEADEIAIALQRIDRKEKKNKLIELSAPPAAASIYFYDSENFSSNPPPPPPSTPIVNDKNTFRSKLLFISRVAAVLILIILPATFIFFESNVNDNPLQTSKKNNSPRTKKNGSSSGNSGTYKSEDITNLLAINLPSTSFTSGSLELLAYGGTIQGYAGENKKIITIKIINYSQQLNYLENKIKSLQEKIKDFEYALKKDNVNNTTSAEIMKKVDQIKGAIVTCKKLKKAISKPEFDYQFDNEELKIYSSENLDPKEFEIIEEMNFETGKVEMNLYYDEKFIKQIIHK